MAIQAVPTISKELYLRELSDQVEKLEGDCPKKEQAWVKVRQASEGDQLQISQRSAESDVMWLPDGSAKETRSTNPAEERMFRAYLVLVDTGNITDADEKPLFKFKDTGSYQSFDGSYSDFKEAWAQLPPPAAYAIELATYTLNPQWDWLSRIREEEGE